MLNVYGRTRQWLHSLTHMRCSHLRKGPSRIRQSNISTDSVGFSDRMVGSRRARTSWPFVTFVEVTVGSNHSLRSDDSQSLPFQKKRLDRNSSLDPNSRVCMVQGPVSKPPGICTISLNFCCLLEEHAIFAQCRGYINDLHI